MTQLMSCLVSMKAWVPSPAPTQSRHGGVHTCQTSFQETEGGRSEVQGPLQLHNEFEATLGYMRAHGKKGKGRKTGRFVLLLKWNIPSKGYSVPLKPLRHIPECPSITRPLSALFCPPLHWVSHLAFVNGHCPGQL